MAHIRVLNHYLHVKLLLLGAVEFTVLVFAVVLGLKTRAIWDDFNFIVPSEWQLLTFAGFLSVCSLSMGVYSSVLREGIAGMFLRTLVSFFFLGTAVLTILYYLIPSLYLGRGVLALAIIWGLVLVILARLIFFRLVDIDQLGKRVLLYGAGKRAAKLLEFVSEHDGLSRSVKIVGAIAAARDDVVLDGSLVRQAPSEWISFVRKEQISEIVVCPDEMRAGKPGEPQPIPFEELLDCKLKGLRINEPLGFIERELLRIEVALLRPSWALFGEGFTYSRLRDWMKRVFDIVLASLILLLVWPFMILTAIAVAAETGRPVLYKQVRVGLNGKDFSIYKFRSMTQDAEKGGKAVWAKQNDSRVTKVGAFIRNTRLDELPQLYNVFKGDMSFVGPRPERPEFVDQLKIDIPFYDSRHRVKPGLMGWAQLKYPYGASVEDANNKLKYDLYYVKNHSFFLDVLIVIQTVEVVLLGKGVR